MAAKAAAVDASLAEDPEARRVAMQVRARFTERSLVLCGDQLLATMRALGNPGPAVNTSKAALFDCMQTQVCEKLHAALMACPAGGADEKPQQMALNRCLAAAYGSLPEPQTPIADVEAQISRLRDKGS